MLIQLRLIFVEAFERHNHTQYTYIWNQCVRYRKRWRFYCNILVWSSLLNIFHTSLLLMTIMCFAMKCYMTDYFYRNIGIKDNCRCVALDVAIIHEVIYVYNNHDNECSTNNLSNNHTSFQFDT